MYEKKQRVLDIAKARFERFGLKKTTMDEICSDAGISKRTLYELFKNKEDLFAFLFVREALETRKAILSRISGINEPLEKIENLFTVSVNYFKKDNFLVNVLNNTDGIYSPYLKEEYRLQVEEGIIELLMDILRDGMKKGSTKEVDPYVTAYCLFRLFQAFTYARSASIKGSKKELQALKRFIMDGIKKS